MPEVIEYAGQFQIEKAEIHSSEGKMVGIEPNILKLDLYEDIDSPWIRGECTLHNQASFSTITPLIGQEYFKLVLKTPTLPNKQESIIDYDATPFHIYSMGKTNFGTGSEAVTFQFVSGEAIKNGRILVSEKLEGSCTQIVYDMLDKVDCFKAKWIESSSENRKIIAPNISPFAVVTMMTKQAVTGSPSSTPNFLFWENFRGYHFRSLDSCFLEPRAWNYNVKPDGATQYADTRARVMDDLQTILSYNMGYNDQIMDQMSGMLCSDLIVHDITSKIFTEHRFNYFQQQSSDYTTVDQPMSFPLYNKTPVNEQGVRIADSKSKLMLMPDTILPSDHTFARKDSQHYTKSGKPSFGPFSPEKWAQRRTSHMAQMDSAISLNMRVHGNTTISCGDMVNVSIPHQAQVKEKNASSEDKYHSGSYLIRRIKHTFTVGSYYHEMNMSLYKNALEEELLEVEDAYEPIPDNGGVTYNVDPAEYNSGW